MLAALGDPQRSFRVVHVGGTNGKGSVAATIASILTRAGHRTGLYTSPHLCTFRERIRFDGRAIGEAALLAAAERAWPLVERETPSFFEATTVIAFEAMAEAGVDVAVVEVGLGGRLDATNVVQADAVVITNIGRDHVEYLGGTLEAIALEKAGIIKGGAPVVTAEPRPRLLSIFAERAAAVGAPLVPLERAAVADVRTALDGTRFRMRTRRWGDVALHTPLLGRHQAVNAALAVHALDVAPAELAATPADVVAGVAAVRWPGRLQVESIGPASWVFDAAHNPAGVEALLAALAELPLPPPLRVVAGILGDKDWEAMLTPLAARADSLILTTAPSTPPERRWDPALAGERLRGAAAATVRVEPEFTRALDAARAAAEAEGGTVLVTGSFHTVGDALASLGMAPDGADLYLPPQPSAV